MKTKRQIKDRINTLESSNSMITNEKGHELNKVRIDELRLILTTPEHILYSKLREFNKSNKFKKNREVSAKMAQIEWALKNDSFTKLQGGKL